MCRSPTRPRDQLAADRVNPTSLRPTASVFACLVAQHCPDITMHVNSARGRPRGFRAPIRVSSAKQGASLSCLVVVGIAARRRETRANVLVQSCRALPGPVVSCLVPSCLVLSCSAHLCLALPCLALSCLVLPCPALCCLVLPCPASSCTVLSCPALSCLALPCLSLPCLALSCSVLPRPILSCHVLSFPVLSSPLLSWQVLSYLFVFPVGPSGVVSGDAQAEVGVMRRF